MNTKPVQRSQKRPWRLELKRNLALYIFVLPAVIEVIIFCYIPMYGVQIAFRNFKPVQGIWGSSWVGMKWFNRFFSSPQFITVVSNTVILSLELLLFSFPISILFALLINQYQNARFKKTVQTVSYAPHFISTVVLCGMIMLFLSPSQGVYGSICRALNVKPINPMGEASLYRPIYIISDIWQQMGWESIIYVAALSSIDPGLYDAATVDGANRFQRILHIEVPSLVPTATLIFIMRVGAIMAMGFEKSYLLQNDLNSKVSEIIATYVYKIGLKGTPQYSYSAAIGLFNSLINMFLLVGFNTLSRRFGETSLW